MTAALLLVATEGARREVRVLCTCSVSEGGLIEGT